ncbi:MAG: MFS transporter [Saccharospirillum sp.]
MSMNARFFLTVFAPFALGYLLSYFYRVVNGVIAGPMQVELALSPGSLGLIGSAYFLFFAAAQLPLGVALDRYDTRKVASAILLIAAAGAVVFATAQSAFMLWLGRGLIGLGVSACLMAAFRAYVATLPAEKLPMINGLQLTAGGIGAITATAPAEWLLPHIGWRGLFLLLAVVTLLIAAFVRWRVPPLIPEQSGPVPLRTQVKTSLAVFADRRFLRIAPTSVLSQATFMALFALWASLWFRDVAGYSSGESADILLWSAIGMTLGYLTLGSAASALNARGISTPRISVTGMLVFLILLVLIILQWSVSDSLMWFLLGYFGSSGTLMFAALTQQFPRTLAGRVTTALNLLTFAMIFMLQWLLGVLIGLWEPNAEGHYPAVAYQVSFGACALAQGLSLLWYWQGPMARE